MLAVGLTGGIGSGKSSVSERLAARGAVIVDADRITRELQEPGQPVFDAIVDAFGSAVVAADGSLDRPAVAAIVFSDAEAKKRLEDIVHPAVGMAMAERIASVAATDDVVILDVPLLVESKGRTDMAGIIVVDVDPEIAVQRLVEQRGFDEADARARIANQASREERLARADFVIDNGGDLAQLDAEVERCWAWIEGLRAHGDAKPPG
jgi:dephospho-CoA kinase